MHIFLMLLILLFKFLHFYIESQGLKESEEEKNYLKNLYFFSLKFKISFLIFYIFFTWLLCSFSE